MMWQSAIRLAETGLLPESMLRAGIRALIRSRLKETMQLQAQLGSGATTEFLSCLEAAPIAIHTAEANQQHYEVPVDFFQWILGSRLKYSCCYWPDDVRSLDQAEERMLRLYEDRARLRDGQDVLELGCGWGSLCLWLAERFPNSRIRSISNSQSQVRFIQGQSRRLGLDNLEVRVADVNDFETGERFDRVISIEMFEHVQNHRRLLRRIASWLKADGLLFIHVFSHRRAPYRFQSETDSDWMGKHFFTGGVMPSLDMFAHLQQDLHLAAEWLVSGDHYAKTAQAWLDNMDTNSERLAEVLRSHYGGNSRSHLQRWRLFFLACAELFGFQKGHEWLVAHHLFSRR